MKLYFSRKTHSFFQNVPFEQMPRLLKSMQFSSGGGCSYVNCGLLPVSNGYAEAVVNTCLVVVHGEDWISLNSNQLGIFFTALRNAGPYALIGFHIFDRNSNDFYLNGRCDIKKIDANPVRFNIKFTDGEYGESYLMGLPEDAIITLLQLEAVLEARLFRLKLCIPKVEGIIGDAVEKYRLKPEKLREHCEKWSASRVEVEMGFAHFDTFKTLVKEFYEKHKENPAYFRFINKHAHVTPGEQCTGICFISFQINMKMNNNNK